MPIPAPLLKGSRCEYTLSRLFEMTPVDPTMPSERTLMGLVLPPWQRPEVWSIHQKQRFIEGIFYGLGCGYYVTNGFDWDAKGKSLPMAGWLIDGQQRIAAIRDFMNNAFAVFDDVYFHSLSRAERMRFHRQPFPCVELDYTDDEAVLIDLYDRLNFGGTPHTEEQRASVIAAVVSAKNG